MCLAVPGRVKPSSSQKVAQRSRTVLSLTGVSSVIGLTIDGDGNFYLTDFVSASRVYSLYVGTGAATPILGTGLGNVHNIAFKTPGYTKLARS